MVKITSIYLLYLNIKNQLRQIIEEEVLLKENDVADGLDGTIHWT